MQPIEKVQSIIITDLFFTLAMVAGAVITGLVLVPLAMCFASNHSYVSLVIIHVVTIGGWALFFRLKSSSEKTRPVLTAEEKHEWDTKTLGEIFAIKS